MFPRSEIFHSLTPRTVNLRSLQIFFNVAVSVCVCVCARAHVRMHMDPQLCPTLCDPVDCSLPGSSVHRIFQARILEWVAISFSRGAS